MSRNSAGVFLLASVVSLASAPVGGAADGTLDFVEGEARIVGTDRPAADVWLQLSERGFTVPGTMTDDEGRFRAGPMPDGMGLRADAEGRPGPSCGVLVQDASRWTWEIVGPGSTPPRDF